ncbi:NADH dehydrogenase [ubiquinone] 1 alpha subcomplex subunit 8-like [Oscarella lobularis]|uniref:NADH dehydrogenase [ubiquinone] 1 alpha subcomplex subunit 8-like n=1 Tax=Oscarella lobularis TaxID=121494 RepID=UPI003313CBD5
MASTETSPLNVEELNVTSAVLVAAAHHYGQACRVENDAFMKCRQEKKDPRACLEEGRRVTQCAIKFFRSLKAKCNDEFTSYWTCLDFNNQNYQECRKAEKSFNACAKEKLGIEKPEIK